AVTLRGAGEPRDTVADKPKRREVAREGPTRAREIPMVAEPGAAPSVTAELPDAGSVRPPSKQRRSGSSEPPALGPSADRIPYAVRDLVVQAGEVVFGLGRPDYRPVHSAARGRRASKSAMTSSCVRQVLGSLF